MEYKKNKGIMLSTTVNYKEVLYNLHTRTRKTGHRALLKKIENSRIIYNRKEPIITAMKKAFILANRLEDTIDSSKKYILNRKMLLKEYMSEHMEVSAFSSKKLDGLFKDKHRRGRFNACRWTVETIDIKDLGVWPCFGGIDHFTTCGNLPCTIKRIIELIKNNGKAKWPVKPILPDKALARFILEEKHADLIYKYYPIIVTAKGPKTRRVNVDRQVRNKFGFGYKITPYDIEDGNHRATALALFGLKKLKCFVGRGLVSDRP
jgi:hypothetical protein